MDKNRDTKIIIKELFIKKICDLQSPNVQAAIITAASKMARISDIISEEDSLEALLDLYKVRYKEEVTNLIGMSPQFVKSSIGYTTDFEDINSSTVAYYSEKDDYDLLYKKIADLNIKNKIEGEDSFTM